MPSAPAIIVTAGLINVANDIMTFYVDTFPHTLDLTAVQWSRLPLIAIGAAVFAGFESINSPLARILAVTVLVTELINSTGKTWHHSGPYDIPGDGQTFPEQKGPKADYELADASPIFTLSSFLQAVQNPKIPSTVNGLNQYGGKAYYPPLVSPPGT